MLCRNAIAIFEQATGNLAAILARLKFQMYRTLTIRNTNGQQCIHAPIRGCELCVECHPRHNFRHPSQAGPVVRIKIDQLFEGSIEEFGVHSE